MSTYSDLARIFTTSFVRRLLSSTHGQLLDQLSQSFPFIKEAEEQNNYKLLFNKGYKTLLKNYRCEYIYKSELYGTISKECKKIKQTGVLAEVRSGNSVADLLWLNGTSIAYEIKTEIDTTRRLKSQINSYSRLFKKTVVVAHESNVENVSRDLPSYVGLMYLDSRGKLNKFKECEEYLENLSPELMFMTLRRKEYESAITEAFGYIPDVSDAYIYRECLNLFKTLSPLVAHDLMVKQLKHRAKIGLHTNSKWPPSLRFLIERGGLKRTEILKLERWLQ